MRAEDYGTQSINALTFYTTFKHHYTEVALILFLKILHLDP